MINQIFMTECGNCGKELEYQVGDFTNTNIVDLDLMFPMEFDCKECGSSTHALLDKISD